MSGALRVSPCGCPVGEYVAAFRRADDECVACRMNVDGAVRRGIECHADALRGWTWTGRTAMRRGRRVRLMVCRGCLARRSSVLRSLDALLRRLFVEPPP